MLSSNMQKANWTEISTPDLKRVKREWKRADGATAVWFTGAITITTPAYEQAKQVTRDKAKAALTRVPKI